MVMAAVLMLLMFFMFSYTCGYWIGFCISKRAEQQMAKDAGVGRFQINQKTGHWEFVYGKFND